MKYLRVIDLRRYDISPLIYNKYSLKGDGNMADKGDNSFSCRICASNSFKPFLRKNDYYLSTCQKCGLLQIVDDLSNIKFEDLYVEEFFKEAYDWLEKGNKGRRKEYEKFHHRMQEIEELYPDKGNILDIGCSYGFFLDVARSRGWNPVGIEIGDYAATFAKTKLDLEVHNVDITYAKLLCNYFDVVTMWNVIEHLNDPARVMRNINRILKKNGLVVFTTGDVLSYLRKLQGAKWRSFIPPIHVTYFDNKSVTELLERTGFSVLSRSVALPRESLLKKIGLLEILKKAKFSDKMMIFASKKREIIIEQ